MSKEYYVYIMTNKSRTLYTGVTNNLMRRVDEHKSKLVPGFTSKYNIRFLIYYESTSSIQYSIATGKANQRLGAVQEDCFGKFNKSRMERFERRMVC